MKKLDIILRMIKSMSSQLEHLDIVATDKAVKLEQALVCVESQLDVKSKVIQQLEEERDALRAENEALRREVHVLEGRLRHLLQSKTIQLFDEKDHSGNYVRDIKRLDTYGVHYKMREWEAKGGPKNARERDAQRQGRLQEGDALAAPGGKMITFPDDNVRVKDLTTNIDILVAHDYIDVTYPGGAKVRFRPEEMKA